MALSGGLSKYIGNEIIKVGKKDLANKTATSALSSVTPKASAKVGAGMANKAGDSLLNQATALGLAKNDANKWILNTSILDTDEGVGKIKDFMNPILGGDKTPSYQRFLEQIGEGEYQMGHRPNLYVGDSETKFPLSNMEADPDYLPKIYGDDESSTVRNLLKLGNTGPTAQRSARVIAQYQNQPDKMVKIFRQAPKDMNYGDWVALTEEYANSHIGNSPNNRLWKREVPASEVMFAGDDINEWGYYPKQVQLDNELGTALDDVIRSGRVPSIVDNELGPVRHIPVEESSSLSSIIPVGMGEKQVSPRVKVAENQASLFDQLDAPSEVKIRAINYLDKPINWAEDNPAFNKLTPAQKKSFADLAVKKLGNNPTTYDVNQLFDPFYKNARKETGMDLFNSEENQNFLNKLGIKDYTSMRGTLANEGEHTFNISNTTGLPYNEKITLNASVMEDMLKLKSTELHEAAHAAWLRLAPEQKIGVGQDLCNKLGLDAKVGKRIANSTDLNELIAYSCEANFTSGNMVGSDGKLLDRVLGNSTAQKHLDNVAKMAGDLSPSFKERVMNVIRAFVDYVKAKIKGIKDIGTFDEFYEGLSSGDFAEDMATPIEKWSAPTKTASEQAKDELFNKLGALHKAREIPSEAFLSIDDMIRPENSIDDIMNYINQVYPDVAKKLTNVVDKRAVRHNPVSAIEGATTDIPVNKSVMDKVAKYLKSPTDASGEGTDIAVHRGEVSQQIATDPQLERLRQSPARDMLGQEQLDAYKRALNGEVLDDEFLKNDSFAQILDQESNSRPYLITEDQEKGRAPIPEQQLQEFRDISRKFIDSNLKGVEKGRKAVIVLGRPSSGKSSGAVNAYSSKKGKGFFELDNDEIKKLLPGYDDGMGANAVHPASSYISNNMVLPELANEGYNIVLPIVGKKEAAVEKYLNALYDRGYEICMVNTNLPLDKCRTRNRTRAYETGRNVADGYLVSVGENPDMVYNKYKENIINGTERRINGFAEISTDVPFGSKARVIENSGSELLARLGLGPNKK